MPTTFWQVTNVQLNIPEYGILDLDKVEYTGIWYIGPWEGRIYWNMVYWTLVRANIPEYGILDLGRVEYTGIWYIGPW